LRAAPTPEIAYLTEGIADRIGAGITGTAVIDLSFDRDWFYFWRWTYRHNPDEFDWLVLTTGIDNSWELALE
jgi:hypothetical protein